MSAYADMVFEKAHDDCDECLVCLIEVHNLLKYTCAESVLTFLNYGDHFGRITRPAVI